MITIKVENTNKQVKFLSGSEKAISAMKGAEEAKVIAETARDEAVSAKDIAVTKASEASSDADQTALDRIATGADRVVVETKASEVASNASEVQTKVDEISSIYDDATQIHEDALQVADDKNTTVQAKDLVLTTKGEVDVLASQVTADAIQVATDKGIVATDKGIVAADKATTLVYKNAAETAKTQAEAAATSAASFVNKNVRLVGRNIYENYQLETSPSIANTDGNTANPYGLATSVTNSTKLGYKVSDCPTGYPAFRFTLGNGVASTNNILMGAYTSISTYLTSMLSKISGKEVTFSYWIKHSSAIAGVHVYKVQNGTSSHIYSTAKVVNSSFGTWYKVEHTFTLIGSLTSLDIRVNIEGVSGGNVDLHVSSIMLRLTEDGAILGFEKNIDWENLRISESAKNSANTSINTLIKNTRLVGRNLMQNYQFETNPGVTPASGTTAIPYGLHTLSNNGTILGYNASDCPTGYPAIKYNLGNGASASNNFVILGAKTDTSTYLTSLLSKLSGKEVTFSFYVKHNAAVDGMYFYRTQNGTKTNHFDLTQVNNTTFNTWYKVSYTFTLASGLTSLELMAYVVGVANSNVELYMSSVMLRLTEDGTVLGFEKNDEWENLRAGNILNNVANGIQFNLPAKIPVVVGNKVEIFKNSLFRAINKRNYALGFSLSGAAPSAVFHGRKFEYTASTGHTPFNLTLRLIDNSYSTLMEDTVTIIPTTKKSSPASNKNILLIGGSFINTYVCPTEFSRRLKGSGGTPVADGLSNLTFVGNRLAGTIPTEGNSGKTWEWFAESTSPFWNAATSQIDFTNYCTVNGISQIDYVVIILGTNNPLSPNSKIQVIYDKLIAHNPAVKIIQGGMLFANPDGVGIDASFGQTTESMSKLTIEYNQRLESLISTSYSANVFWADILPTFDIENNMQWVDALANQRNTVTVRQGTDNVHPSIPGYNQIADTIYNAFHYWCLS